MTTPNKSTRINPTIDPNNLKIKISDDGETIYEA